MGRQVRQTLPGGISACEGGCQTAVSTSSDPGRELLGAIVWHTGLLEEQGQFNTQGTVGRSTVSVAQRDYWEKHSQFITKILLLVFFHSTEQYTGIQ